MSSAAIHQIQSLAYFRGRGVVGRAVRAGRVRAGSQDSALCADGRYSEDRRCDADGGRNTRQSLFVPARDQGFLVGRPERGETARLPRLFVDFELSSIWHRAYSFAVIDIDAPSVNAIVAHDGILNLSQLKPKTPPAKPPQKAEPVPAIRIGAFNVSRGRVT